MSKIESSIPAEPDGLLAASLTELAADRPGGLIFIARSENRAARLSVAARALAPELAVITVPAWDCMPYDHIPPSARVMGERIAAVRAAARASGSPCLLIASVDAILQQVAPPAERSVTIGNAEPIEPQRLVGQLGALGYRLDERVDDPGEVAVRGEVIDIFPADSALPCRIEYAEGRVTEIRGFDPLSQRSVGALDRLTIGPASEIEALHEADLTSLPAMLPDASLVQDAEVDELRAERWSEIRCAFDALPPTDETVIPPERLYLGETAWVEALAGRRVTTVAEMPRLGVVPRPGSRSTAVLLQFVRDAREAGRRIGLSGPAKPRRALLRALERAGETAPEPVADFQALRRLPPGTVALLEGEMETGFVGTDACVLTPADLLGAKGLPGGGTRVETGLQPTLRPGDAVVHDDEGVALLRGIETVESEDLLRLEFAGGDTLMVPAAELHKVWRYGGEASGVALDHLGGGSWAKRRADVEVQIGEMAKTMASLARGRRETRAPAMRASAAATRRFAARFPFPPTLDQEDAIEAVTADLAAGRPMDRLVCGDVGFGKTEVALRAAAIAAMSGWQVAVVAPTTVLARQHAETFARRFERTDITIGALSRLTRPDEARAVRAGLADGSIKIAIGTQALAAREIRFKRLGLLIIDEEQHLGTRQKAALTKLRRGVHVLTLTATPIPRTLHSALAGLQELSIIATPPGRRQPVRSFRLDIDGAVIGQALRREKRRHGQSFVVCPRVEDIAPMRARLAQAAPELTVIEAHGGMKPAALEDTMVRFAGGDGDVLLSTNIVESGLDVPRANTMLVWRPDRFGLSQLHQLRGRVGRGRVRGVVYLLTDPKVRLTKASVARLDALEANERLGGGFAISARDLDLRGAGDLLGETQAGHVKLIGIELTQQLLQRALDGRPKADWTPELTLELPAFLPSDYVADADLRVEIHVRLARARDGEALDALEREIEDRFGPLPAPVEHLIELARLRVRCLAADVASLDVGPAGAAARLRGEPPPGLEMRGDRVILARASRNGMERLRVAAALLERITSPG